MFIRAFLQASTTEQDATRTEPMVVQINTSSPLTGSCHMSHRPAKASTGEPSPAVDGWGCLSLSPIGGEHAVKSAKLVSNGPYRPSRSHGHRTTASEQRQVGAERPGWAQSRRSIFEQRRPTSERESHSHVVMIDSLSLRG